MDACPSVYPSVYLSVSLFIDTILSSETTSLRSYGTLKFVTTLYWGPLHNLFKIIHAPRFITLPHPWSHMIYIDLYIIITVKNIFSMRRWEVFFVTMVTSSSLCCLLKSYMIKWEIRILIILTTNYIINGTHTLLNWFNRPMVNVRIIENLYLFWMQFSLVCNWICLIILLLKRSVVKCWSEWV